MITIYGVLLSDGTHVDVSKTIQGAKNYATRNGYKVVTKRLGYNARVVAKKDKNRWVKFDGE